MLCGSGLSENVTAVLDQLALSSEVLGEEIVKEWLAACFVLRWSNCFLEWDWDLSPRRHGDTENEEEQECLSGHVNSAATQLDHLSDRLGFLLFHVLRVSCGSLVKRRKLFLVFSPEIAKRSEIKVKLLGPKSELLGQFPDLLLQFHQRKSHLFNLVVFQRAAFHAADGLALKQAAQKFDEA